jgi:transcriptional regulator with XRE-family HTH domain
MERNLKDAGLIQEVFAGKAGVALTVIRKIEQGKRGLQLEKVYQRAGLHSLPRLPNQYIIDNIPLRNHMSLSGVIGRSRTRLPVA